MTAVNVARMLVRACGVIVLVLGLLFWLGDAPRSLVPIHMLLGIILVVCLWLLALMAARVGVSKGLVATAVVVGLLTAYVGAAQGSMLPDPGVHWIVQVVHLVLGMAAIGLGEALAGRAARGEAGRAPAHA
jgi:uncharacterized membrane protein